MLVIIDFFIRWNKIIWIPTCAISIGILKYIDKTSRQQNKIKKGTVNNIETK